MQLILDRISKGINDKVNGQPPLQKAIFKFAYDYKKLWSARGYETPLLDKLIFKKIAKLMGGRVRVMMAGGAPLSPDTHEQIKICLCTEVIQGYGLTETTSGATVMDGKCFYALNFLVLHCIQKFASLKFINTILLLFDVIFSS